MPHKDPDNLCIVMKNNAISNNVKAIVDYSGEILEETFARFISRLGFWSLVCSFWFFLLTRNH